MSTIGRRIHKRYRRIGRRYRLDIGATIGTLVLIGIGWVAILAEMGQGAAVIIEGAQP